MMRTAARRSGFTLLEFVIAAAMLVVIGGAVVMATRSSTQAFRTGNTVAGLDSSARRYVDRICEILQSTSAENVTPTPAIPFSSTAVDFQRGLGTKDGAIVWGILERIEFRNSPSDPDDGEDNDGNGLVDEGQVVLISNPGQPDESEMILCSGVGKYLEGESPNGLDDNDNGRIDERGLAFDYRGNTVTVHLTIQDLDAEGFRIDSTVKRTIAFRNQGDAQQ